MADELGGLVVQGIKTATSSLLWEYETKGSRVPQAGDLSIILDGSGAQLCLIETVSVEIKPFNAVGALVFLRADLCEDRKAAFGNHPGGVRTLLGGLFKLPDLGISMSGYNRTIIRVPA